MIFRGIYRIKNVNNGKTYVGQSIDIRRRWRDHVRMLRAQRHDNIHLQRSWNKHGADAFRFEILCIADVESMDDLERSFVHRARIERFDHNRSEVHVTEDGGV